jgi:hypothetical protein
VVVNIHVTDGGSFGELALIYGIHILTSAHSAIPLYRL